MFVVVSYIMFFFMGMNFMKNSSHLLMSLLSLEGMMIMVFFVMNYMMSVGLLSSLGLVMFSYVSVCEGAMGLSLLIGLVRGVGKDKFYFLDLL